MKPLLLLLSSFRAILGCALVFTAISTGCAPNTPTKQAKLSPASNSTSPASVPTLTPKPALQMTLYSQNKQAKIIAVEGNTDLVYLATWCPYSKAFKSFLTDKRIRDYAAKRNLVFVFSNEWPTIKKKLEEAAQSGEITRNEIPYMLEAYKLRARGAQVIDPSFFRGLPGPHYFAEEPSQVESYPTVASEGRWPETLEWIYSTLEVPENVADPILKQYGLLSR